MDIQAGAGDGQWAERVLEKLRERFGEEWELPEDWAQAAGANPAGVTDPAGPGWWPVPRAGRFIAPM